MNSAATLGMTLLSLTSQTGVSLEIFVVDSGSTDGTREICETWNVTFLYAEPGNMYRAINKGLSGSKTDWLGYLNSDDWLYPESLTRLIAHARSLRADIAYGNCDFADGQGRFIYSFAAARPHQLLPLFRRGRMGFAQPAAVFSRKLFQERNGYDERYRFKADVDFYIRAARAGSSFAYCDDLPVACFRVHERQQSIQNEEEIKAEGKIIFGDPALAPHLTDWSAVISWRYRNLPHYLIRIMRESLLSKRLRLPRSIESYRHQ
jgi:glycosyltransferase involved in cell wall biosynthesis